MSDANKLYLKHALISILVGAAIAFLTSFVDGLLVLLKDHALNFTGPIAGIIYYLKARRIA